MNPVEEIEVIDLEFVGIHGNQIQMTLVPSEGDRFEIGPGEFNIYLSEKSMPSDPSMKIPAEEIVIYKQGLASVLRRSRMYSPPSKQKQKELYQQFLGEASQTVN